MQVHFYITESEMRAYRDKGNCYVSKVKDAGMIHVSLSLTDHIIEKVEGKEEYMIMRVVY